MADRSEVIVQETGFDFVSLGVALLIDVVAVVVLAFAIYLRRHRRRDLVMAFTCLNAALFTVVQALSWVSATAGLALGFGLFAALSIVRLRSEELRYSEVAYFFSALALAIVNGLGVGNPLGAIALSAIVLGAVWAVDRPQARPAAPRRTELVLDDVYADEAALRVELERRLGAQIVAVSIEQVDYVRESTRVDVRYVPGVRPTLVPVKAAGSNGRVEVGQR
jgi:hypothetical protein